MNISSAEKAQEGWNENPSNRHRSRRLEHSVSVLTPRSLHKYHNYASTFPLTFASEIPQAETTRVAVKNSSMRSVV